MGSLSNWARLSPEGWAFGEEADEEPVGPMEFLDLWQHFRDTGELPTHGPSRRLILRIRECSDEAVTADGLPPDGPLRRRIEAMSDLELLRTCQTISARLDGEDA